MREKSIEGEKETASQSNAERKRELHSPKAKGRRKSMFATGFDQGRRPKREKPSIAL